MSAGTDTGAGVRRRLAGSWPGLTAGVLAAAFLLGFGAASGHVLFDLVRAVTQPVVDPPPVRHRLLGCSNIEQAVVATDAVDIPADVPGWRVFTTGDRDRAVVTVRLRKEAGRVVFFPRFSPSGGAVAIDEPLGNYRRALVRLTAPAGVWSPIGLQYPLALSRVENGWSDEEFPVTLRITLTGRGVQLWHRGNIVFFEAP